MTDDGTQVVDPGTLRAQAQAFDTKQTAGVYLIWDGDKCLYVGESQRIEDRLREHATRWAYAYGNLRVTIVEVPGGKPRRMEVERRYQIALRPSFNVIRGSRSHCARVST